MTRQYFTATCTDTEGREHTLSGLYGTEPGMRDFARRCFRRQGVQPVRGSVRVVAA